MSIANLVAGIEYEIRDRLRECQTTRGHGPWLRLIALDFTKPHECTHCGVRVAGIVKGFTNHTPDQRKD